VGTYIVAIDQSTSATKAVLFDSEARRISKASVPHRQYYPQPGFVEHDAEELYANTLEAARRCVRSAGIDEAEIAALSITNQRETALIWDRYTGKPIANAVVWQCLRGAEICRSLDAAGAGDRVKRITGLLLDPYFSASKLSWLLEHTPDARSRAKAGDLLFGTIDSWLVWKLSGGAAHVTDYSNACRTLLFDIDALEWSLELLELFGVPDSMAPEPVTSDVVVATTCTAEPFAREIPIAGLMGDSHAALFGEGCTERGAAKATYGTGSSIMMNIGLEPIRSERGVVTSVGYGLSSGVQYAFEGNIHSSAGTIQWLVDDLELIADPSESADLAASVDSTDGVYLVPAFAGLGAPWWDNQARGLITGMTRGTKKAHVVRAAVESIAYQICDLLEVMQAESGIAIPSLKADGGATGNAFLMQFQADMIDKPVRRAAMEEVSALGSACAAGIAVGMWADPAEVPGYAATGEEFVPAMGEATRAELHAGWRQAVERTRFRPEHRE